jgi:1,4-dihydroxy-2-naphthoyl-CoA hydrolase
MLIAYLSSAERIPKLSEIKMSDAARSLMQERGLGELAEKMGIELLELSAERTVARMPAIGNRQPLGLVNGGAYLVLGETLGSISSNVWANTLGKFAVGIEINASHSKSCKQGFVTAICESVSLGGTLAVHEIVCYDDGNQRLSTVRMTNLLRERRD